jgi:hypothetical protein
MEGPKLVFAIPAVSHWLGMFSLGCNLVTYHSLNGYCLPWDKSKILFPFPFYKDGSTILSLFPHLKRNIGQSMQMCFLNRSEKLEFIFQTSIILAFNKKLLAVECVKIKAPKMLHT